MSDGTLFGIGAVIFLFALTAIFLYGTFWFENWRRRPDQQPDMLPENESEGHAGPVVNHLLDTTK